MQDQYQRQIDYLRVSVTDRCNLRCRYCMPERGVSLKDHREILRLEEISRIIKCAAELGFAKLRFTGGEPLVRKGFLALVRQVKELSGIEEITVTTNGILLKTLAEELKLAGVDRVNVSLDTLDPEKFHYITRQGKLEDVLQGIENALLNGLEPLKINTVVMKGFNDNEILDFAHLTLDRPLHVRFIELMPIGQSKGEGYLPLKLVKEKINSFYSLEQKLDIKGSGPAKYYAIPGAKGSIGFISALSEHFCHRCNRLRLTSDGKLRPCLHKNREVDLRETLRCGASDAEIKDLFLEAVRIKPKEHDMEVNGWGDQPRGMSQIGG